MEGRTIEYITPKMRQVVIDWLIEVAQEYDLHDQSLHLSIAIFDDYCSQSEVTRQNAQLLSCVCILLASKLIDEEPPCIEDLVSRYPGYKRTE